MTGREIPTLLTIISIIRMERVSIGLTAHTLVSAISTLGGTDRRIVLDTVRTLAGV